MNVYELAKQRISETFKEFNNIYVSFSGGKDSGVVLNLCIDHVREHYPGRKFTVLYIDLEAMYSETVDFVKRIVDRNSDVLNIEWVCLPMFTTNSVSMYNPYWTFWEKTEEHKWVRPMPVDEYVINQDNVTFPFYRNNMSFEMFVLEYARWKSSEEKTACLLGIRTEESLNRWRAINRTDVSRYKELEYTVQITSQCFNIYPIYDWKVKDIWVYNGRFSKDYNKIYDLMFRAGVPLHKMRICEPYGDEQKAGLHLFKVIEPKTWVRVVDRVSGANFGNIYANTKATGTRIVMLPKGHTWRSYCKFLLKTLPEKTRTEYMRRFIRFINYWRKTGSPLTSNQIDSLSAYHDYIENTKLFSTRGKGDKHVIKFRAIPEEIPGDNATDMLSWKRMCMAIIKNDITCRTLSFSMTKKQIENRNSIKRKYEAL